MTGSILLYGATGYTGKLIAREARAKGASVDAALKSVSVVLNAAGPFSATARPMADACVRVPATSGCSGKGRRLALMPALTGIGQ